MGCTAPNRQFKYIHEVDENHVVSKAYLSNTPIVMKKPGILEGTKNYVNPNLEDYETELEKYKNKTVIGEIISNLEKHPNLEA